MASENALFDYVRDLEATGVNGATWELIKLYDDAVIASGTTGPDTDPNTPLDGKLAVDSTTYGYPGPTKYSVTDLITGITREHTSKSIGAVGPMRMIDLPYAFMMMLDGVVAGFQGGLLVTATGTPPAQVSVASGAALGHGMYYRWPVAQTVPIDAGGAQPRIDLVVLRYYLPGNEQEGKIELVVRKGVEAASPVVLPPVQDDVSLLRWDLPLAQVRVDAGVNSIAASKVTDRRAFTVGPKLDTRYMRIDASTSNVGGIDVTSTGTHALILRDDDGTIRFYVENGTPAMQLRNGTDLLMYSGNKTGLLFRVDGFNGQMDFGGIGKPTFSLHAAMGGAAASIVCNWGNDNVAEIKFHTGATPAQGNLAAIIFNKNRQTNAYRAVLTPANGNACDLQLYSTGMTADHFDVTAHTKPAAGTDYLYTMHVVGTL